MKLRPVTFRYRQDPEGVKQYGLVAEEVERIYPELVIYGADGKVETVRYLALVSMLLNELQKQRHRGEAQAREIETLSAQVVELKAGQRLRHAAFEHRLAALEGRWRPEAATAGSKPDGLVIARPNTAR